MSIVLVVDDSPLVLNQVHDALQAEDLGVLVTENPLEVPRLIQRRAPSLVLVDIHMPTMRGDVVARIVRRAFGDDVVILLHTEAGTAESDEVARACGADGVVPKSDDLAGLRTTVRDWLARPAHRAAGLSRAAPPTAPSPAGTRG